MSTAPCIDLERPLRLYELPFVLLQYSNIDFISKARIRGESTGKTLVVGDNDAVHTDLGAITSENTVRYQVWKGRPFSAEADANKLRQSQPHSVLVGHS